MHSGPVLAGRYLSDVAATVGGPDVGTLLVVTSRPQASSPTDSVFPEILALKPDAVPPPTCLSPSVASTHCRDLWEVAGALVRQHRHPGGIRGMGSVLWVHLRCLPTAMLHNRSWTEYGGDAGDGQRRCFCPSAPFSQSHSHWNGQATPCDMDLTEGLPGGLCVWAVVD